MAQRNVKELFFYLINEIEICETKIGLLHFDILFVSLAGKDGERRWESGISIVCPLSCRFEPDGKYLVTNHDVIVVKQVRIELIVRLPFLIKIGDGMMQPAKIGTLKPSNSIKIITSN